MMCRLLARLIGNILQLAIGMRKHIGKPIELLLDRL